MIANRAAAITLSSDLPDCILPTGFSIAAKTDLERLYIEVAFPKLEGKTKGTIQKFVSPKIEVYAFPTQSLFDQRNAYRTAINTVFKASLQLNRLAGRDFLQPYDADAEIALVLEKAPFAPDEGVIAFVGSYKELESKIGTISGIADEVLAKLKHELHSSKNSFAPLCIGVTLKHEDAPLGQIDRGWLFLENGPELHQCFQRTLVQLMGLTGRVDDPNVALFRQGSNAFAPNLTDIELLRMHASPSIKPGMTAPQVRALLDDEIAGETCAD